MADGTRKTVSELLASSAPKIAANLQKRRLIPFKSLPTQMGTVAALTYCLKQHPSLLTLSQVKEERLALQHKHMNAQRCEQRKTVSKRWLSNCSDGAWIGSPFLAALKHAWVKLVEGFAPL